MMLSIPLAFRARIDALESVRFVAITVLGIELSERSRTPIQGADGTVGFRIGKIRVKVHTALSAPPT